METGALTTHLSIYLCKLVLFFRPLFYFVFSCSVLVLLASRGILSSSILVTFIMVRQFHFFFQHIMFWVLFVIFFLIEFFPKKIREVRA